MVAASAVETPTETPEKVQPINIPPVTRVGNLTADFELRFTNSGKAVASSSIAVQQWDSEKKENGPTVFYDVSVWGEQFAGNVVESLFKGDRIVVHGTPAMRVWTDKEDQEHQRRQIHANAIGPDLRFAQVAIRRNAKTAARTAETSELPADF